MLLEYRAGTRQVALEFGGTEGACRVAVDGSPVEVELIAARGAELELRIGGRRHRAFVVRDGAAVHVSLDGRAFTFLHGGDETADEVPLGGPRVTAPLPGKVVKVLAAAGQAVRAGESLLILEAMKMETEVAAPLAGTVAAVHVQPGGTVALGEPLVDITPLEGPAGAASSAGADEALEGGNGEGGAQRAQ